MIRAGRTDYLVRAMRLPNPEEIMRSIPHLTVMSGLCLLLLASCGRGDPAPPADTSPLPVSARSVGEPAGPHEVTVVDVADIYDPGMMAGDTGPKPGWRLLGAMIETPQGPWFYKLTGPEATVDHWASSFFSFAESLRLP